MAKAMKHKSPQYKEKTAVNILLQWKENSLNKQLDSWHECISESNTMEG